METGVRSPWRRAVLAAGLVAFGVAAQAKVLVYDGFYYDPHDSTAYTTATVGGGTLTVNGSNTTIPIQVSSLRRRGRTFSPATVNSSSVCLG